MPTIPYKDPGMAGQSEDVFTYQQLITGNAPTTTTAETADDTLVQAADFAALTVVGRNASGDLVPAVLDEVTPANSIPPIGITTATVLMGTAAPAKVAVWRDGCFNPDALIWDASYDTDEKKRLAFEAGENQVYIRKPLFAEGV